MALVLARAFRRDLKDNFSLSTFAACKCLLLLPTSGRPLCPSSPLCGLDFARLCLLWWVWFVGLLLVEFSHHSLCACAQKDPCTAADQTCSKKGVRGARPYTNSKLSKSQSVCAEANADNAIGLPLPRGDQWTRISGEPPLKLHSEGFDVYVAWALVGIMTQYRVRSIRCVCVYIYIYEVT